ncbi:MAG: ABC transporter substrate-binding protein [Burkholderiales bacterium]|nr:ABC transporter substrate-binding protein [Burkholderiales bacterium]
MRRFRHLAAAALCTASLALASSVVEAQKTVRIGAPLEVSGRFVAYGAQGQRGVEMAVEAFGGSVAGHKIEVLLRDIQSTNQGTVSAMTELLENEKVDFVVGPITSGLVSAAVPAWRQRKPLWIVPGSSATSFEEAIANEPMVFHTYPWAYHYHDGTAKAIAAATGKGKRVAILYSDGSYGRSQIQAAKDHYAEAGFEIVATELVRENATDMSPVLQKIRIAKPDVLVGIVQTTDGIVLAKQIHVGRLGIPYLVGTAYPQLQTWSEAVGEAANGWIGATTYLPGMATPADSKHPKLFPAMKDWEAAFRKKYNRDPEFLDVTVYTSTAMLLLAIDRAGGPDKERVAKELKNLGVQTMLGDSKFIPTKGGALNQAFNEMVVYQRQDDKFVTVWPKQFQNGTLKPRQ